MEERPGLKPMVSFFLAQGAVAVDYDAHDGYIYFSQVNSKKMSRVLKGSTKVEDMMAPSMNSSTSLTWRSPASIELTIFMFT